MSLQVTSPSAARIKWQQRTAGATQAYQDGVRNPSRSWQAATAAAQPIYVAAVIAAANAGAFAQGVNAAGDSTWQSASIGKGSQRWAPGVQAAGTDYESGVSPYFTVLAGLTLTDRGPAGSPNNETRSLEVQRALHQAKVSRVGR